MTTTNPTEPMGYTGNGGGSPPVVVVGDRVTHDGDDATVCGVDGAVAWIRYDGSDRALNPGDLVNVGALERPRTVHEVVAEGVRDRCEVASVAVAEVLARVPEGQAAVAVSVRVESRWSLLGGRRRQRRHRATATAEVEHTGAGS